MYLATASGSRIEFFFEKLAFVEVGVFAVESEEFVVGAAFDDAAIRKDAYKVGVADSRNAMRNDKSRAIFAHITKVVEYRFFGICIDRA